MTLFELRNVTKRFGKTLALDNVSLRVARGSLVGLVGRNGSGKTTLLHHVTGLVLPTSGIVHTLGVPAATLDRAELARMGVVHQHDAMIEWMTAAQMLRYVSSFYDRWDRQLEERLVRELDVSLDQRIGAMSPGNRQKLSIVLATSHHPELLLLDEPLSDLDPIARQTVIRLLLDRFMTDEMTIVISSHMLHDIETVVDHIVCLEQGRIVADDALDVLKERHGMNLEQIFALLAGGSGTGAREAVAP